MRARQFIVETKEPVGREFQHIEDLAYIYGPVGAMKAVERLAGIGRDGSHLEVKWDGSPAIIFGRNDQGQFHFGDKYSKQFNTSADMVHAQYAPKTSGDANRSKFAGEMMALYSVYEQATPLEYRGFLECGLLFKTRPPLQNNEYSFQANTVIYHVDANSNLGQLISRGTTCAAATAYFKIIPGMGGQRAPVGNHYNGIGNQNVIIIPPKFTEVQAKVPAEKLKRIENFVKQSSGIMEEFLTPSPEWSQTFKNTDEAGVKWRESIYKYVNSQVDVPGSLNTLGSNMVEWAATDPVYTAQRRSIATDKITNSQDGLKATFLVVRAIMNLKDMIIDQIEKPTLASLGIRATLPGNYGVGGEGFVSDVENGVQPLKLVKRGGFTAANRQTNWGGKS